MRRTIFALVGLVTLWPLLVGQGCMPTTNLEETATGRVYRLCRPLYSDDYIRTMIGAARNDRASGFTYNELLSDTFDGCDNGCGETYYTRNDEVRCVQTCYPCAEALLDLAYDR